MVAVVHADEREIAHRNRRVSTVILSAEPQELQPTHEGSVDLSAYSPSSSPGMHRQTSEWYCR